jgi:hypothetical protein
MTEDDGGHATQALASCHARHGSGGPALPKRGRQACLCRFNIVGGLGVGDSGDGARGRSEGPPPRVERGRGREKTLTKRESLSIGVCKACYMMYC